MDRETKYLENPRVEVTDGERIYHFLDKSSWILPNLPLEQQPWLTEPDKVQFKDKATGLDCLAVRHDHFGHWCGYIGIPETHPLSGVNYNSCPLSCGEDWCEHRPESLLSVHGGITFSDFCQEDDKKYGICHIPAPGEPDHVWWFGWDAAHCYDLSPGMEALILSPLGASQTYRTLEYVREECANLARQLKEYNLGLS